MRLQAGNTPSSAQGQRGLSRAQAGLGHSHPRPHPKSARGGRERPCRGWSRWALRTPTRPAICPGSPPSAQRPSSRPTICCPAASSWLLGPLGGREQAPEPGPGCLRPAHLAPPGRGRGAWAGCGHLQAAEGLTHCLRARQQGAAQRPGWPHPLPMQPGRRAQPQGRSTGRPLASPSPSLAPSQPTLPRLAAGQALQSGQCLPLPWEPQCPRERGITSTKGGTLEGDWPPRQSKDSSRSPGPRSGSQTRLWFHGPNLPGHSLRSR